MYRKIWDKRLYDAYVIFKNNKQYAKEFQCIKVFFDKGEKETYPLIIDLRKRLLNEIKPKLDDELIRTYGKILKETYMLGGRVKFEDFLIAIEWDKAQRDKFYNPRPYLKSHGIVDAYQDLADGKIDILTISLPKRAGKSQMGILFTLWLSAKHPDRSTLMEGVGEDLINSFYEGCLNYLDPKSGYNFYDIFGAIRVVNKKADTHIIDLNEKSRFPTIMCRSIDARQIGLSEATNLLYLDDCVEGYEEAMSRDRLEQKWKIISGDIMGRMVGCPMVVCGTRYSIYDPIGMIKDYAEKQNLKIKSIEIPALDDNDISNYEFYNPKLERKQFTTQYFKGQRELLTEAQWMSEFQQKPFESRGLLFSEKELNYFFELPINKDPDSIMAVCDTAEGGGDSTMLPVAYVYGDDAFIVDCVFDNATPTITKSKCAKILTKHRVGMCVFESNNAGTYYARDVEEIMRGLGGKTSIRTKRTITNKQTRIELASDNIKKHFYFLDRSKYKPGSDYARMMKELTGYTRMGKMKHDDAPDGLSLLENEMRNLQGSVVEIRHRFF